MRNAIAPFVNRLRSAPRAFLRDERGNIAMVFGLSMIGILTATGAGIDLSRAFQARQKLSEVATLACQYASRPTIVQLAAVNYVPPPGGATYGTAVQDYITEALASQRFGWTQTDGTPFTYTPGGAANVGLSATVPTALMQLVGIDTVDVQAEAHCYDNPTTIPPINPPPSSPFLVREGFELASCQGTCYQFYPIPGHNYATPKNTFTQAATYTGSNGNAWFAMGYCLETDSAGVIKQTVAEGGKSAELDCDNGSGNAGNSSISTKVNMVPGNYELRYNVTYRVDYPNYRPTSLCATTSADLSWANDTRSSGGPAVNALRSNQLNVYLDASVNNQPPTHTTIFDNQTLAGANRIDTCVFASEWVERSVRITVTTVGDYWLSFAADGQNDSYGAQLDNIRLCRGTCPDPLRDNFPTSWLAANNGGVSKVLFQDTFEAPVYATATLANGNMNSSTGVSAGWPDMTAIGWSAGTYNQVDYNRTTPAQGAQAIELDALKSGSQNTSNRLIGRPFLLDPGYYRVQYSYRAGKTLSGVTSTTAYCGATPAAAGLNGTLPAGYDTNILASFMAHSQLVSTPQTGNALNAATNYTNTNTTTAAFAATTSTTPTVQPNAISLTAYNAAQVNPVLDICGYPLVWTARTRDIKIVKPGFYWLIVSALGTADNSGGQIDDVKLTALGSPYMASPPTSFVAVPSPAFAYTPAPDTTANSTYTGFKIVANALTPPAALQ